MICQTCGVLSGDNNTCVHALAARVAKLEAEVESGAIGASLNMAKLEQRIMWLEEKPIREEMLATPPPTGEQVAERFGDIARPTFEELAAKVGPTASGALASAESPPRCRNEVLGGFHCGDLVGDSKVWCSSKCRAADAGPPSGIDRRVEFYRMAEEAGPLPSPTMAAARPLNEAAEPTSEPGDDRPPKCKCGHSRLIHMNDFGQIRDCGFAHEGGFCACAQYRPAEKPTAPRTPDPDDPTRCWHGLPMTRECGNCAVDAQEKPTAPASTVPAGYRLADGWRDGSGYRCSFIVNKATKYYCGDTAAFRSHLGACLAHAVDMGALKPLPAEPPSEPAKAPLSDELHGVADQLPGNFRARVRVIAREVAALEARLAGEVRSNERMRQSYADLTKRLADTDARYADLDATSEALAEKVFELEKRLADAEKVANERCRCTIPPPVDYEPAYLEALRKYADSQERLAKAEAKLIKCMAWPAPTGGEEACASVSSVEHAKAEKERDEAVAAERARVNGWWRVWDRERNITKFERDAGIESGAPAPKDGGGAK